MMSETKEIFETIGLEIKRKNYATNSSLWELDATFLEDRDSY